ncbi:hypothetical protein [Endozoicomonas sp. 4G]|uniref:hypothetical protein n=1 Tax=Endozoicomonas sp. 4G TaxID=2872754 RepID=UPI0020788013|nr:hypothetical protein [Endozoicomonas sp. 4G]
MEQLLKSLFFFLPFMASVEAHIPDGLTPYRLPGQAATLTESLVTLGVLALRQQTWQPLPYNPEKNTEPEPYNNPSLHISSDDYFIVTGSEPVPGEHTLCQPIDTSENETWQCFGMESITSVTLDTQRAFYLKTHPHQSTVAHYSHEPKLSLPKYDLPDYRIFLKKQQAEMERIHKIAAEGIAMGRVKIKITEEITDKESARRVYIAKTNGITVKEQKDIEQEAKRHREDAHAQPDGSAMEGSDIHLTDDTFLCLASTRKACREVLSKIVSCANSESDSTRENTSAPPQEASQGAPEGQERNHARERNRKQQIRRWRVQQRIDRMEWYGRKVRLQKTYRPTKLKRLKKPPNPNHQQLLNQYLEGFHIVETPMDNFCWLHAIRFSAGQDVSTLIQTLTDMLNNDLPANEQAQATEHSAYLSDWMAAQGEENVQLVREQLMNKQWPDFNILLPLLSHLFKKTFVVVNLQARGLIDDQVFTYATSNDAQVTIVSEASAINTPEERVYLGLLPRNSHFVGIRPGTWYAPVSP